MNRLVGKLNMGHRNNLNPTLLSVEESHLPVDIKPNDSVFGELLSNKPSFRDQNPIKVVLQGNLFGFSSKEEAEIYIGVNYEKDNTLTFLKSLNGSFNFVLYDTKNQKLFIVTDKYGSRPLFVYSANDQFVFASEVKHLLELLHFTPDINWVGWGQYLTFRFTLGSNTFFKGVELVGNGTFFEVNLDNNTVKKTEYWNYSSVVVDSTTSFEDKVAEGTRVFQAVFNSLGKDLAHKRFILALSGGYDSRSIAAGLHKYMSTASFDTVTTLHPCGSEIEIVRELASTLGLSNKYVERPNDIYRKYFIKRAYATDGLVQEHLWAFPLEDTIKNYETYIDGIAGDIIMRSTRVRPIHAEKYMDLQYLAKLFKKQFGFEYSWLKDYVEPKIWEEFKYSEHWAVEQLEKLPNNDNRMTYFLMNNRVRNGISIVPSNMLGRFVPEVIQPFFDDRIALFGLSLPLKYKFSFIYRSIIDAAYPEISRIRSTSDEDLEKLKNYDVKITRFDDNPRELINDYLSMSDADKNYLIELLNTLEVPPFLDVKKFIHDEFTNPRMNRINTIVDMMLWYNLFISKKLSI